MMKMNIEEKQKYEEQSNDFSQFLRIISIFILILHSLYATTLGFDLKSKDSQYFKSFFKGKDEFLYDNIV